MSSSTNTEKGEILLVEDNPLLRRELSRKLVKFGHAIREAANSREALSVASQGEIRLMLLDNILEDQLNGVDLAKKIHVLHPDAPVIFIGGIKQDKNALRRARRAGLRVGGNLEKPVEPIVLARLIDRALEPRRERKRFLTTNEDASILQITAQVDAVYDKIIRLIAKRRRDPNLKELVAPLREELAELQEKQADAMERHFNSQLLYDTRQGQRIINRARKMLGKR